MNAIPYIIITIVLFFLYQCECKKIRCGISISSARRISFVVLLLFIGCRGHIYSDFISYYPFYKKLPDIFNITKYTFTDILFEPGFIVYSSIIKTIIPDYFGWIFISTLIDLLVFNFVFKRYTSSRILPFIFFMAFNGLLIEFNLYRNIKAIDLFLLSLPYLEKRKLLPYMLLNILGMTFHSSSIVYIPLYFVLHKEIPKTIIWGGIIVANAIFLLKISVINDFVNSLSIFQAISFMDKLTGRVGNNEAAQAISLGYIERTFSIITFTLLYNKLVQQHKSNIIFYNCFWLYYTSFLFFYEIQVLVERIPTLFMFSYWILYPKIIIDLHFRERQIIYITSFLFVFLKIYAANISPAAKYENILWDTDNYEERKQIQLQIFEQSK